MTEQDKHRHPVYAQTILDKYKAAVEKAAAVSRAVK